MRLLYVFPPSTDFLFSKHKFVSLFLFIIGSSTFIIENTHPTKHDFYMVSLLWWNMSSLLSVFYRMATGFIIGFIISLVFWLAGQRVLVFYQSSWQHAAKLVLGRELPRMQVAVGVMGCFRPWTWKLVFGWMKYRIYWDGQIHANVASQSLFAKSPIAA